MPPRGYKSALLEWRVQHFGGDGITPDPDVLVHRRQGVRNALMAIDAGLTRGKAGLVHLVGAPPLHRLVEVFVVVAIAALLRVVGGHPPPFILGQAQTLGSELLRRIDGTHDLAVDLA